MSAVTLPIQLDDRLVSLSSEVSSTRIASLFKQLSHAVSINAKVLLGVQHAIRDIQKSLEDSNEHHRKEMLVEGCRRDDIQKQTGTMAARVAALESSAARQVDVDAVVATMQKELHRSTEFIHEMEQGNGDRVNKFVSGYIEAFMPKWWSGEPAKRMKNLSTMVHDTADQAAVDLERRTTEAEEKRNLLNEHNKTH